MIEFNVQQYQAWRKRYSLGNHHSKSAIPHENLLTEDERRRIVDFYASHIEDGYKRYAWMMVDMDRAYVSPCTVYDVIKAAGVVRDRKKRGASKRGQGFEQPKGPHQHWHIDFTYIHVGDTLCVLVSVIDGLSRCILSSYLSPTMTSADAQIAVEVAHEAYPGFKPRFISDNERQFTGKEFGKLLDKHGFTHVCTTPCYPESNA